MPAPNSPPELPNPPGRTVRDWNWWTEFVSALLLGLAAVASGWAAYQSTLWSSNQIFSLNDANRAERRANALEIGSSQLRSLDIGVFLQYLVALSRGDKRLADFLYQRFRPEVKPAVDAWLATRPLLNPSAPRSPFVMKEYQLSSEDEVGKFERSRDQYLNAAQLANKRSDTYVLMTVPFAIVSLFCGLSSKFGLPQIRTAIVVMALVVFIAAAVALAFMPVA